MLSAVRQLLSRQSSTSVSSAKTPKWGLNKNFGTSRTNYEYILCYLYSTEPITNTLIFWSRLAPRCHTTKNLNSSGNFILLPESNYQQNFYFKILYQKMISQKIICSPRPHRPTLYPTHGGSTSSEQHGYVLYVLGWKGCINIRAESNFWSWSSFANSCDYGYNHTNLPRISSKFDRFWTFVQKWKHPPNTLIIIRRSNLTQKCSTKVL